MMLYRRRRGIDNFSKMRAYLKLGDSKGDEVPEDTIKAVADTLRTSKALKVSEDGKSFLFFFLNHISASTDSN